ncbi:outer membrane lipoprotein carrier protein LolA [Bacillus sp. AGMB 02131]|uniref:Outer membrane lipoprotein carrier protein LolA n=1 Tax=Peribacillus faecalis TaxID=2772559 RepID=A0A927D272_9BACI|nr:outer membrane lipoprotein carrier protein LolA [Peribacillus faecalis]MBD3109694.1 outer membrane lipoprotein carrier protein LolA [Peribacillus faecalis]
MKKLLLLAVSIFVIAVLSACGQKSQEDVVQSLNKKMEEMKSYKAQAKMTLKMGEDPQVYDVEIWYKSPDFYRVELKNEKKEQSQMILRNKDGVYVLTPALNKSFHFESDWPKNSSQAYLYESLVKDIMEDPNATFKATENQYVFETKTRYQNSKMLPFQEVILNKKDLAPISVKIKDPDHNVLVTVEFSDVSFNPKIEDKAFDMKTNMTGAQLEIEALADMEQEEFVIRYPAEINGIELVDQEDIVTDSGERSILTYEGDRSFTMIAERAKVVETSSATSVLGDVVDLGFTVGAITDYSISWTYEGIDYTIASQNLSREEMVEIARSVYAPAVK